MKLYFAVLILGTFGLTVGFAYVAHKRSTKVKTLIEVVYEDSRCRIMRVEDSDGAIHHWSTCGDVIMNDGCFVEPNTQERLSL